MDVSFPARVAVACLFGGAADRPRWSGETRDPQQPARGTRRIRRSPRWRCGTSSSPGPGSACSSRWWPTHCWRGRPTAARTRVATAIADRAGSACGKRICVHYAVRGADAPPSQRWVRRTLRVLGNVWDHEVDGLRFRPPPADGRRGGDSRFDVYLAELGGRGLFGYCTPERRVRGERFAASSYCVLDDDFARRAVRRPRDRQPAGDGRARVLPRDPVRVRLP